MWNGAPLLLTLLGPGHGFASLDTQHPSCFDADQPAARVVACEQIASAAPLRPEPGQQGRDDTAAAAQGAGKGALIGAGIGLGIGLIAGLVFGPSCEEGHAGCTAGIIIGSTALFAIIGAIDGASGDGDGRKDDDSKPE